MLPLSRFHVDCEVKELAVKVPLSIFKAAWFVAALICLLLGNNAVSWAKDCGANNVAETLNPFGDLTSNIRRT
jgi:hypothetical protein